VYFTISVGQMKAKTIQMRWHDQLPILGVDFEPRSSYFKSNRKEPFFYRLVTSGSDGYVRVSGFSANYEAWGGGEGDWKKRKRKNRFIMLI
jgi:hypothetical protein